MKVLYSELKTFLPQLSASAKEVGQALTLTGFMMDSFEEVKIGGKRDYLIGLEVRQNRPDGLGVLGVAREVAAYFNIKLTLPKRPVKPGKKLAIAVNATSDVKRVCVVQVDGLNNSKPSPAWLRETIEAHGMNPVSLLVDISNYAMLMTGFPNHIFDAGKVVGGLVWERSSKPQTLTTLDGTVLELHKNKELVVSDNLGPLVLASAVGGRRSAISPRTTAVLAEVAVYDPVKVATDSKGLGVVTEASGRLEKFLDPELCHFALEFLITSLEEIGGGRVTSEIFDYYAKTFRPKPVRISIEGSLPAEMGGLPVSDAEIEKYLKRLSFEVSKSKDKYTVTVPTWRPDVVAAPDVAEEVLRLKGFDTIPTRPPMFAPVDDITAPHIRLAATVRTRLETLGLDEVLTLPLTTSEWNMRAGAALESEIRTQNAINEEVPVLRTSLIPGLVQQQHQYLRQGLGHVRLFEVGKVFWKGGRKPVEIDGFGLLFHGPNSLPQLQEICERLLLGLGVHVIEYDELAKAPELAAGGVAWNVVAQNQILGKLYKVQKLPLSGNKFIDDTAVAEFSFGAILEALSGSKTRPAQELLSKVVALDVNVEAGSRKSLQSELTRIRRAVGKQHLWSVEVVDAFTLKDGVATRYTIRVSYKDLTDEQAKNLHEKVCTAKPTQAVEEAPATSVALS